MKYIKLIIITFLTAIAAFYLYAVIDFLISPYDEEETLLGNIMVYVLFIIFGIGYSLIWKNFKISGIIIMSWYFILLILAEWVWRHGGMTILIGAPIFFLGLVSFLIGLLQKK